PCPRFPRSPHAGFRQQNTLRSSTGGLQHQPESHNLQRRPGDYNINRAPPEAAWARFCALYQPLIQLWVARFGVPEGDRDDVVQDVFVTLKVKLETFEYDPDRGRFRGYLYEVTRSRANDWHRRAPRTALLPPEVTSPGDPIGEQIEAEYQGVLVRRAVEIMRAEFEEITWRAFWEYVVEDRPPAEVAAELGLSVDSVYTAKKRVLRTLRRELDGLLD
ncbi:MAG: sigma-70 family RNA polymerase sigma factor, partial [Planctomycetes bacterium]|nr:sigma-70 family RNA polymerase sigma factor [Planctomycetota bacterium]